MAGKAAGTHEYVQHLRLPGMLHARVIRPRGQGAYNAPPKLLVVDEGSIAGIPARVVRIGDFLAVVSASEWDAVRAARAARCRMGSAQSLPGNAGLYATMRAQAATDRVVSEKGDAAAALAGSAFRARLRGRNALPGACPDGAQLRGRRCPPRQVPKSSRRARTSMRCALRSRESSNGRRTRSPSNTAKAPGPTATASTTMSRSPRPCCRATSARRCGCNICARRAWLGHVRPRPYRQGGEAAADAEGKLTGYATKAGSTAGASPRPTTSWRVERPRASGRWGPRAASIRWCAAVCTRSPIRLLDHALPGEP